MNLRYSTAFLGTLALVLHVAGARAQGTITGLTFNPSPVDACALETIRVSGTGQCGVFTVDLGDGTPTVHLPGNFPILVYHAYTKPGTYTPLAHGQGNCSGTASAALQVHVPQITGMFLFSQLKPDGWVIIEGQNFGKLPGKAVMHYTAFNGQQHDVQLQSLQWGDNFASGQIPFITGVLDQTVTFTLEASCGVQSNPWPANFTAFRDVQSLPWQRISCSMDIGPGSGDRCQDQGETNWPLECSTNFPPFGTGLNPTGLQGYHSSGWGNGGSGYDTFNATLHNGWVLDSVTPLQWDYFGGSVNATERPLWSTASIPQEGVQWRIDSCTMIEYWADIVVTGPIDVPYRRSGRIGAEAMRAALIVSVSVLLALSAAPRAANAQQPAPAASPTVSAKALTRAQFLALSPDTVIDFGNERLTKREFQDRNSKAAEEAVKKLPELRQRALDAFEARRKELLDRENAALDEGNEKVRSEIARRVAADAAAQGPNWEARKQQAAELLHRAARASPAERSALEKQAADLLAPSGQ